jgi:hypothetical protein
VESCLTTKEVHCSAQSQSVDEDCAKNRAGAHGQRSDDRNLINLGHRSLTCLDNRNSAQLRQLHEAAIDPRRAGLLLYGLQIASLNLPKPPADRNAKPEPVEFVEEITTDPELGNLAPRTEVSEKTERKSTVAKLIERIMQGDPQPPSERIPQNEHSTSPAPRTRHHPHPPRHGRQSPQHAPTYKEGVTRRPTFLSQHQPKKRCSAAQRLLSTQPQKASSRPERSGVEGPPHFAFAVACSLPNPPKISFRPEAGALAAAVEKSASPPLSRRHDHSWLLYPIPASTPRIYAKLSITPGIGSSA